jgi:DNA processing protein
VNGICPQCARRTWLLAELGVRLDFRARDLERFWSLLELPDRDLIEAVGGRRRAELHAGYDTWEPQQVPADESVESVCLHHPVYPAILREDALAPHTLSVRGGMRRLTDMLDEKVVAIVGTRRATDYGMELARELARGLAASGLTVASGLGEGISSAVQAGVLEARARPLSVIAGSLGRCSPAWCAPLYRRIVDKGCAISELQAPSRSRDRAWWQAASDRTLALLAQLTIVVEAGEHPRELACPRVARTRGREVAAVPGRVSSPASKGTNALLMGSARLIRDTQDALDVLYGVGAHVAGNPKRERPALEARLASVLERVGRGQDTVAKLTARGSQAGELALALAELELQGFLLRGDGGRYVPSAGAASVGTR